MSRPSCRRPHKGEYDEPSENEPAEGEENGEPPLGVGWDKPEVGDWDSLKKIYGAGPRHHFVTRGRIRFRHPPEAGAKGSWLAFDSLLPSHSAIMLRR